jgi:hypothetical protein
VNVRFSALLPELSLGGYVMKRCVGFMAAALVVLACAAGPVAAQNSPMRDAANGNPAIKSIEAISFGPAGMLLVGDGKGSQVVAIDTADTTPIRWSQTSIANVKDQLAGRLGATAKDVEIRKIAVNPASQTVYIAVRMLAAKKDLLMTVDGNGKIKEFSTENVRHIAVPLPQEFKVTAVTDLTWAGDRILVATQANETFGSKIFTIMGPLSKDVACTCFSTETFHVGHNAWETKAPIKTVIPYEENGKKYLVGAFTCTPIVKYALDDMQPGGKVKGISVVELGMGNTPQDMFVYEKGGKKFILMNVVRMGQMQKSNPVGPSEYWTAKVDFTLLQETKNVNKDAMWRGPKNKASESVSERAVVAPTFHGVMHMDQLDADRALVIRKDDGGVSLQVLPLP